MKTTQGFLLIDVDVAALNNAGNDPTTNLDNAVATKKIKKNGNQGLAVLLQQFIKKESIA